MSAGKRIFVLALDGTPYSFLNRMINSGKMPNLATLVKKSSFAQMDSVLPPVSSVAWASFMTGCQPHQHGIMGFIDRDPSTMEWYVPLADRLREKTLWTILSEQNKRVFVMNVPMTYPPQKVNGIMICGFLGSDITKGTYPSEIGTLLKAKGYRIDSDVELAKKDLDAFINDLNEVLEKRIETMWEYFEREKWEFFMTHIMETDRLHHFTWELMETRHPKYESVFMKFYQRIDRLIGDIIVKIPKDMDLILLSDHGFTTLKKEVYLNRWLWEKGLLRFTKPVPNNLKDIHPSSIAYSLYPGRIYINLKGREKTGSVNPGLEYEQIRRSLKESLLQIQDPRTAQPVIKHVLNGEEIYGGHDQFDPGRGQNETNSITPDLIAAPYDGYDLKGALWRENLFEKTVFNGMHTFDDAFILARERELPEKRLSITDISTLILDWMGEKNK
ncbi:MAG: alkaline phosphatase family protein [Calditrichaceae bacterium]